MECCRIIPEQTAAAPELAGSTVILQMAAITPALPNSLSDPDPLFHPPRL